jgi:hypothetical protein
MTYGILDIFYVPVAWLISLGQAIGLNDALCIAILGAFCGYASMLAYRYCSPQAKLATLTDEIKNVRTQLMQYDGDFDGMFPLIATSLRLSLRHLGLSGFTAILASMLSVLIAFPLSTLYDFIPPKAGESIAITVEPKTERHRLNVRPPSSAQPNDGGLVVQWPREINSVTLWIDDVEVMTLPMTPMSNVLEHRHAFNALISNPNGYLAANLGITRVAFNLQPREIISFGPAWIRPWWFVFFSVIVSVSFWLKWRWRLH